MIQLTAEVLFKDYSATNPVTEQVRKENENRVFTGGVRINNSLYRTAEEDKYYRESSLNRKLP